MAISCGVDIIKISRIQESIEKMGDGFKKRIYTDEEISYCESKRMCMYESYAARFAAKEAVYKALSPDESKGTSWREIEVIKQKNGKPGIRLHGAFKNISDVQRIKNIEVSLSHDNDYAIANVVIEK